MIFKSLNVQEKQISFKFSYKKDSKEKIPIFSLQTKLNFFTFYDDRNVFKPFFVIKYNLSGLFSAPHFL